MVNSYTCFHVMEIDHEMVTTRTIVIKVVDFRFFVRILI